MLIPRHRLYKKGRMLKESECFVTDVTPLVASLQFYKRKSKFQKNLTLNKMLYFLKNKM